MNDSKVNDGGPPMPQITSTVTVGLTPQQVAEAFWDMGSDQQAAFYAHLNRIARTTLCFQAAWIVRHIVDTNDNDARDGFNRLHAHVIKHNVGADRFREARDAIAKLIAAAERVNGDHVAPHDCYATGPLTGDPHRDLVECPGCQLAAALTKVRELMP